MATTTAPPPRAVMAAMLLFTVFVQGKNDNAVLRMSFAKAQHAQ
jgi:hypothetical protein